MNSNESQFVLGRALRVVALIMLFGFVIGWIILVRNDTKIVDVFCYYNSPLF